MTQTPNLNIKIDIIPLGQVSEIKFLGITVDNSLKWKPHIDNVKKISQLTGIIYSVRDSINKENLRQIYLSLTYPHLRYCSALLGGRSF